MKKALTQPEIEEVLRMHPDWKLQGGKLVREWTFKDFVAAMAFVNQVAGIAEAAGHHPDIDIRYNKVRLVLSTHSKGGLTELDFALAERIDTLSE